MIPKPIVPPKRKKQQESQDQRAYVQALNMGGNGRFFRIKTMGTFDPVRMQYRKHFDVKGIPDIIGFTKNGIACFIEVKRVGKNGEPKKLVYAVKISDDQKLFLLDAHRSGCRAGVAFNLDDCLAIVKNDSRRYPRHPRTYAFLPAPEREKLAGEYEEQIKRLRALKRDPLGHVLLASSDDHLLDRD